MSSIYIKVEALPGFDIRRAIEDAITLANRLNVSIHLVFNEKVVYVRAFDDIEEIYDRWKKNR